MKKEFNLSISNIAWDKKNDEKVANLLNRYDINLIDIAISKYFKDLEKVSIHVRKNHVIGLEKEFKD